MIHDKLKTVCLSSLSKVFADEEPSDQPIGRMTALQGETASFQVAYRSGYRRKKQVRLELLSELGDAVRVRTVGLVPSELPVYGDHDGHVLRTTPGLYPDPLYPLEDGTVSLYPMQWRSLWITIELPDHIQAGLYPVEVRFVSEEACIGSETFEVEVLAAMLPEQKLIHTEWFHADCLAVYYGLDVFSEAHWHRIDQFIETAVKHGINMILTPLFTPPLDTAIGGERPTVQLVDVEKDGETYRFRFDRLTRWIELCLSRGVKYFEFSHLFTQWGAKHAPKITATENGAVKQIFGWDTDAGGEAYISFLHQFLDRLLAYVKERGLEDRVYFHVSDEPRYAHGDLEFYRSAQLAVADKLRDYPMIDALSDFEFHQEKLVRQPIPSSNHIGPFLEDQVNPLWTYYCCSQYREVSNRFFCFPSARNRVIGLQLYKFDIEGFLHWGYNFYFSQYSVRAINPFQVTDADGAFPSGDAFLVYPGENGPIESIRLEVFYEALQDLRALQKLEGYIGKEQVVALIEEGLEEEISFDRYPRDAEWLLHTRERINRRLAACEAGNGSS